MGGTYKMRKEAWTSEPLALGFGCRSRTLPGEGEGKRNKKIQENIRDTRFQEDLKRNTLHHKKSRTISRQVLIYQSDVDDAT